MNIIAVDDEKYVLEDFVNTLKSVLPDADIFAFYSHNDALKSMDKIKYDIAFLDIQIGSVNGLALAKQFKEINPLINIVFTTAYSQYALDAFAVHPSGYLLKPVSKEQIITELENLRNPLNTDVMSRSKGLWIQCFGNFEVFWDGVPVHFPRSRAKELLAYLVHKRGSGCTQKEIAAILYGDKAYDFSLQRQIQTIISTMMKVLTTLGIADVIIKKRNNISVDISKINCDYYKFLNREPMYISLYIGEYMNNYDWAEFTVGFLDSGNFV